MSVGTRGERGDRLLFLDNLRYLVIVWVVVFHVSAGLSGFPEFIRDADSSVVFAIFNGYSAMVMMVTLLYVAGYFASPSLQSRGTRGFLIEKVRRLGLPWLIGVVLLGPIMPFLGYYSRSFAGLRTDRYWDFWQQYIGSGLRNWHLPIDFTANPRFHHQHFWFLSVLLLFFAVYAALAHLRGKWPAPGHVSAPATAPRPPLSQAHYIRAFAVVAIAAFLGLSVAHALGLRGGVYAFVLTLEPYQLCYFGGVFCLGVYARARGWYIDGSGPGWQTALVLAAGTVAAGAGAAAIYLTLGAQAASLMPVAALAAVQLSLLSLVGVTSLTRRYMNYPSRLNANLAANSYNVYLVQYPVILVVHLMTFTWETSPFLKFVVMVFPSLLISYGLSEYLIKPRPRLAVLAALGVHAALCLVGLPRTSYSHLLLDRQPQLHAAISPEAEPAPLLPERPAPDELAHPQAGLAWQDGRLYHAGGTLRVRSRDGTWEEPASAPQVGALASLPDGRMAAVDDARIVVLGPTGEVAAVLAEADSLPPPSRLVSDGRGGLFFERGGDNAGLGHISASGYQRRLEVSAAGAGALGADGGVLFWTEADEPWVHAYEIGPDGGLGPGRRHAEIFLADGRYGRERARPVDGDVTDMAVDRDGHLLVINRVGLQVFGPGGELLGVRQLPDGVSACAFGERDLSVLYLASPDQVYALETLTAGAGEIR